MININSYILLDNGKKSHFKYNEFIKSETAIRFGIKNTPNEAQWHNIEVLVRKILEPIRLKFGSVKITSGFRTPELCLKIGSGVYSNHTRGEAADFETLEEPNYFKVMKWINDNLQFREMIAEYFPYGWIHVSHRFPNGNKKTIKLKDKKHNYVITDMNYIGKIYGTL